MQSVHHQNFHGKSCLRRESILPFELVNWAELNRTENIIILTVNISPWTHAGARAKSTKPFLAGNQINVIFVERAFYRLNQRNALNRSDDLIFLSIFRDATQDGKNLTLDSHRRIQKTNKTFPCRKIK